MTISERETKPTMQLAANSIRAVRFAQRLALSDHPPIIGVSDTYSGIMQEMDEQLRDRVLALNGINKHRFIANLILVRADEYSQSRIDLNQKSKPVLSPAVSRVVSIAIEHAKYRRSTEVTPSHLLIGVAKYAEEFASDHNV